MTDKLAVYRAAAFNLEERRPSSLTENTLVRRTFDDLWTQEVDYCLAAGLWRSFKRIVKQDADSNVTPSFGWLYAFRLPDDWLRTVTVSTAEALDPPLLHYVESGQYIFASTTPLYLAFISDDNSYGYNLGLWSPAFTAYVAARIAYKAAPHIAGKENLVGRLEKMQNKERRQARGVDAMNDPVGLPPVPDLVRARRGSFGSSMADFGGSGEND